MGGPLHERVVAEGTPAWEAADVVEADRLVTDGHVRESNHYEEPVGEPPMSVEEWSGTAARAASLAWCATFSARRPS